MGRVPASEPLWEDSIAGPIEGTVRILERLRRSGYQLVGLTNWSGEKFRLTQQRYDDVFRLFDEIVVSGEVGLVKPEAEIFELLLRKIGRLAEECLFIDDSAPNIAIAAAMGFRTIHFQSPSQLEEELKKMAVV